MISDAEWIRLWRGCLAGDRVLAAAFCRQAALLARRALARRSTDPDRLDDRIQEFFAHLFEDGQRRLRSYRPEMGTPLSAYLRVLVVRFDIDRWRGAAARREAREIALEGFLDALVVPPEVEGLLLEQRLRRLVDALPPREREAVLWRLEGLRDREIADRMDITPGGVGALLSRARGRLEGLAGGGDEP